MEAIIDWLIFLSQLPTNPSSLRVTVWRKMRAAGALGLQNSAWIFPHTPENEQFLQDLLKYIQQQGAGGQIFKVAPLTSDIEEDLLQRFRAERDLEYSEFCERGREFLAEIEKETKREKFTFAELEEIEDDLQKLIAWIGKIRSRDFAGASRAGEASDILNTCQAAFEQFSQKVYAHEGLPGDDGLDSGTQL